MHERALFGWIQTLNWDFRTDLYRSVLVEFTVQSFSICTIVLFPTLEASSLRSITHASADNSIDASSRSLKDSDQFPLESEIAVAPKLTLTRD